MWHFYAYFAPVSQKKITIMWWLILIYFALNIVITAVSLVINWNFQEWKVKDIISIVAMVLFGMPILVFGLIYCWILGRKELRNENRKQ